MMNIDFSTTYENRESQQMDSDDNVQSCLMYVFVNSSDSDITVETMDIEDEIRESPIWIEWYQTRRLYFASSAKTDRTTIRPLAKLVPIFFAHIYMG